MRLLPFVVIAFVIIPTDRLFGQDYSTGDPIPINSRLIQDRDYFIVYDTIGNENSLVHPKTDNNAEISLIVEFIDEPPAKSKVKNLSSRQSRILSAKTKIAGRVQQLRSDLMQSAVHKSSVLNKKPSGDFVKQSYYKVYSGANVNIPPELVDDIKALPYIKDVYQDMEVKITLGESVKMINADKIWEDYGVYGKGIKVGIIDTGIDYTHQGLGKGYGTGFKVAGGYDFVNDDDDPMDNHGHGTHVAGIVAANGPVKGVAPEATLFALKALSEEGRGYYSDVIAAIEWSVDPNNDGDPSDKLHVVNMSLGGIGNSDDPMSTAVDNAVNMGVVFCVAAGNDRDYYTIGSPGSSRNAITVGSVDKSGRISYFSSGGPTPKNFLLKPDIVAPGGNIQSTILGGGYAFKSGTSMASPHVAGAVALILNLFPDWKPAQVKSALMQTATPIPYRSVFDQGKGLLNMDDLAKAKSLISPGSISFGFIQSDMGIRKITDTINVQNSSDKKMLYEVDVSHNQIQGVNFNFNVNQIELLPGERGYFVYSAAIDPGKISISDQTPPNYGGKITINVENNSYYVPYSFNIGNLIAINFDEQPSRIIIHNRKDQMYTYYVSGTSLVRPLTQGIYDIITVFRSGQRIVVRENVAINKSENLEIKVSEAKNKLTLKGLDIEGKETRVLDDTYHMLTHKSSNLGYTNFKIIRLFGFPNKFIQIYFSDITDAYEFQTSLRTIPYWNDLGHYYNFPVYIDKGINKSFTYVNDPNEVVKLKLKYLHGNKNDTLFFTRDFFNPGQTFVQSNIYSKSKILTFPFEWEEYLLPIPNERFVVNRYVRHNLYDLKSDVDSFDKDIDSLLLSTAKIGLDPHLDEVLFVHEKAFESSYDLKTISKKLEEPYVDITLKSTLTKHLALFEILNDEIILNKQSYSFFDALNNNQSGEIKYVLTDSDGNLIANGELLNSPQPKSGEGISIKIDDNQQYKMELSYSGNQVSKKVSETLVGYVLPVDTGILSYVSEFNTSTNGKISNQFSTNEKIKVTFGISGNHKDGKLFYKKENQNKWIEIVSELINSNSKTSSYAGSIEGSLTSGYYSLKLALNDSTVSLVNHPAFYVYSDSYADSLALVEFYYATNGDTWKNNQGWLESSNFSDWFGVTTEGGRVVAVDLPDNNLKGEIPASFSKLTALKRFNIQNNNISFLGDLGSLNNLEGLNVSYNNLTFQNLIPNLFIKDFTYAPQDSIGLSLTFNKVIGDDLIIKVYDESNGNQYGWFRSDNKPLPDVNSNQLSFDNLSEAESGGYYCVLKNQLLPELELYSKVQFVNVTKRVFRRLVGWNSVIPLDHKTQGVNWVDFDNDSDLDLFLIGYRGRNFLLKNEFVESGEVKFADFRVRGVTDIEFDNIACSWADYNNDGYHDFHIVTRNGHEDNILVLNKGGSFELDFNSVQLTTLTPYASSTTWVDYNNDGLIDLFFGLIGNPNWSVSQNSPKFYNNSPDFIFTKSEVATQINDGIEFASWSDYDNDYDMDLVISSSRYGLALYKNNDGQLELIDLTPNNEIVISYGFSWGDCDNDGDMDLFVARAANYTNLFFENIGNGQLKQIKHFAFSKEEFSSFGSAWGDYDNDGDIDLFVSNPGEESNELWRNELIETGELNFRLANDELIENDIAISYATAWADYDNDGDLDLFVANSESGNYLYENILEENNWINIALEGTYTNRSSIGTKVRLKSKINGKDYWQLREVSAQTGRSGQNSLNVEFGLGNTTIIDSLIIEWPGTGKQILTNVEPNQFMKVKEPVIHLNPLFNVKMAQNETTAMTLEVANYTDDEYSFSICYDQDKLDISIDGNTLNIVSGDWIGNEIVKVTVNAGEYKYSIDFNIEVYSIITSVQEPRQKFYTGLYPNPSKGDFILEIRKKGKFDVKIGIYNQLGLRIFDRSIKNVNEELKESLILNTLSPGIYILKMLINQQPLSKKIIIK